MDGAPDPANPHDVDNFYGWAGCCNRDCSVDANSCQPNAAAAARCAVQAFEGTQGCRVCANGTCDVDPFGYGAITTVWDWLTQVNADNFAGHDDWRLPSEAACNSCGLADGACSSCDPHELEAILYAPYPCASLAMIYEPCIASIFGPTSILNWPYWSGATESFPQYGGRGAWAVSFYNGLVNAPYKAFPGYVRAVRSDR